MSLWQRLNPSRASFGTAVHQRVIRTSDSTLRKHTGPVQFGRPTSRPCVMCGIWWSIQIRNAIRGHMILSPLNNLTEDDITLLRHNSRFNLHGANDSSNDCESEDECIDSEDHSGDNSAELPELLLVQNRFYDMCQFCRLFGSADRRCVTA